MFNRNLLIVCGLVGLSASSFASAPVHMGQITLNSLGYTSNSGSFMWNVVASNTSLFNVNTTTYTYCMSENNLFSPSESQTFQVWGIAGASAADITASNILSNNQMAGLTSTSFLEAAAQAQSYGVLNGITPTDNNHNNAIHFTESNGDTSFDSMDYSNFYYLQEDNPRDHNYGGQPQGFVAPAVPEPATIAVLGMGVVSMLRRRKKA